MIKRILHSVFDNESVPTICILDPARILHFGLETMSYLINFTIIKNGYPKHSAWISYWGLISLFSWIRTQISKIETGSNSEINSTFRF